MSAHTTPRADPRGPGGQRGSSPAAVHVLPTPRTRRTSWSSTFRLGGDQATLSLSGELDIACEAELTALLTEMEAVAHPLIVDLAAVTFADSFALRVLFDSAERRRDARRPALLLSDPGELLARVLCLLGAQRVLDTEHLGFQEGVGRPAVWYAC